MGEHKEPWSFVEESPCYDVGDPIPPLVVDCDGGVCAESAYDGERIVDCVNAMAGVRSPLEWVPLVSRLLSECRDIIHGVEFDWEEAGNVPETKLVDLLTRIDEALAQHEKQGDK